MRKNTIIKNIFSFGAFFFVVFGAYLNFEPSIVDAVTDDITVTQAVTSDITISDAGNVNLTGTIYGMTGGTGTGSATWTVKTSDAAGFDMSIQTDNADCMDNGANHFNDYSTTVSYNWVAPAVSGFGFTVEPATVGDTVLAFRDNGSVCGGAGAANATDTCWSGFNSTTPVAMVHRTTPTDINGQAEVVKFKSQLLTGQFLPEGNYIAHLTVTALVN